MPTLTSNQVFANRYRLIRNIGSGGFSEVWLAADQMAGDLEIALKIYAPGQGLDDQAIQIFRDEYKVVFYLNHPNLLKPSHFDINNGRPYLVLPYCASGSVMKMTGKTDEATVAKLLVQIGGALQYLHSQDPPVIHRDIKPENILADISGNYYLSDFGISSKLRRTLTKSMGRNQESSGTTAFMAPELFQAKRQVLPESDIFAFGTMLYELITDELPFGQIGGAMLMNGAEVPDMSDSCSPGLAEIIGKCLNLNPINRTTGTELVKHGKTYLETGKWTAGNQKEKAGRKTMARSDEKNPVMNVDKTLTDSYYGPTDKTQNSILLHQKANTLLKQNLQKEAWKTYFEILDINPDDSEAINKINELKKVFTKQKAKQKWKNTFWIILATISAIILSTIISIIANANS
ncbi:MAG: serine/threonine-protein kinase [Bacteroidetes bacterium]|nr:serine/threonine-protein kinase [Bacteroidota bacterium]